MISYHPAWLVIVHIFFLILIKRSAQSQQLVEQPAVTTETAEISRNHTCDVSKLIVLRTVAGLKLDKYTFVNIKKRLSETRPARPPRIIDVFGFLNEEETLIIRLHELDAVVDHFVIAESMQSFTGHKRNLVFPEMQRSDKRLLRFLSKITYVSCDFDPISPTNDKTATITWQREYYLRDVCMHQGLRQLNVTDDDMIMLSDVDEFPPAAEIDMLARCGVIANVPFNHTANLPPRKPQGRLPTAPVINFVNNRLHFNFHCRSTTMGNWRGTVVFFGSLLKHLSLSRVRKNHIPLLFIGAGWHVSNFHYGNMKVCINSPLPPPPPPPSFTVCSTDPIIPLSLHIQLLVEKYASYSHQEVTKNLGFKNTEQNWATVLRTNGNELKRGDFECKEVGREYRLPRYVVQNPQRYKALLNRAQLKYIYGLNMSSASGNKLD